ncbi:MAG TPA: hypothetical protein VMW32_02090 [Bacteroidales bacterium]|nr:hypothetical protein [Bacteroidales bacterium]
MDKLNIIFIIAVFALVAFMLYKKYYKKEQEKPKDRTGGTLFKGNSLTSVKEDDYEPYSKKKE